jgi:hypothetical protein
MINNSLTRLDYNRKGFKIIVTKYIAFEFELPFFKCNEVKKVINAKR